MDIAVIHKLFGTVLALFDLNFPFYEQNKHNKLFFLNIVFKYYYFTYTFIKMYTS